MEKIFHILSDPEIQHVIAQILTQMIGFFLFYLVMKKYAWKPILKIVDERREKVENEFNKIDSTKKELEKLKIEYENKLAHFEIEAKEKMLETIHEGKRISEEIVENAHKESQKIIERGLESVELEYLKAQKMIKDDVIRIVLNTVEKVILSEMNEPKHHHLVESFIDRIGRETKK